MDVHQGSRLAGSAFWQAELAELVGVATVGQALVGGGRCSAEYVLRHGHYIFTILIVGQARQDILWEQPPPAVLPSKKLWALYFDPQTPMPGGCTRPRASPPVLTSWSTRGRASRAKKP